MKVIPERLETNETNSENFSAYCFERTLCQAGVQGRDCIGTWLMPLVEEMDHRDWKTKCSLHSQGQVPDSRELHRQRPVDCRDPHNVLKYSTEY